MIKKCILVQMNDWIHVPRKFFELNFSNLLRVALKSDITTRALFALMSSLVIKKIIMKVRLIVQKVYRRLPRSQVDYNSTS